jgi:hypothetical protein
VCGTGAQHPGFCLFSRRPIFAICFSGVISEIAGAGVTSVKLLNLLDQWLSPLVNQLHIICLNNAQLSTNAISGLF